MLNKIKETEQFKFFKILHRLKILSKEFKDIYNKEKKEIYKEQKDIFLASERHVSDFLNFIYYYVQRRLYYIEYYFHNYIEDCPNKEMKELMKKLDETDIQGILAVPVSLVLIIVVASLIFYFQ